MSPDKVKLSPESARTFLEIGLKYAINEQQSASEERKKSLLYSLAKMLCVKKFYLYCSYPIDPDFYRLNLEFEKSSDSIKIYLALKAKNFNGQNHASLTYGSVRKLVKLLLPSYVGAYFYPGITAANFEQYLDILKHTKGKIGLNFNWRLKEKFTKKLLETFARRTYALDCDINQFEAVESLQFPAFDYLFVSDIVNSDQILRVMKCKTKELKLHFTNRNFTIDASVLVNLKNEAVKKLHLSFEDFHYIRIEELIKQLPKSCSNLKHFEIEACFYHHEEFSANQIPDRVVVYVESLNDLKSCLGNSLVSTNIYFYVPIYFNGQRNDSWMKDVSSKLEFKHWQFESDARNYGDFELIDSLTMKFEDARCKLSMSISVFNNDAEEEEQFFENYDEDQAYENEDEDEGQISADDNSKDQASDDDDNENEDMDVDES